MEKPRLTYIGLDEVDEISEYHLFKDDKGDKVQIQVAECDNFVREHWQEYGLAPYFIAGWYSLGYGIIEIDEMLRFWVGPGYDSCNVTYWIEQCEKNGIVFLDGEAVFKTMGKLIRDMILQEGNGGNYNA